MLSLREIFTDNPSKSCVASTQPPEAGEWTRIEMSHAEVDGKYFLSLSVGGREVGRMEADPRLRQLTLVKVVIGDGVQSALLGPQACCFGETVIEVSFVPSQGLQF